MTPNAPTVCEYCVERNGRHDGAKTTILTGWLLKMPTAPKKRLEKLKSAGDIAAGREEWRRAGGGLA